MVTIRNVWQTLIGHNSHRPQAVQTPTLERRRSAAVSEFEIAPDDPIIPYFQSSSGPLDVEQLVLDSPTLAALRETDAKLVVPLVSQGELIGRTSSFLRSTS